MTSHALGRLAGSRRTLLYQRAAGERHLKESKIPLSIDVHLLEEQSFQILSRSYLKRRILRLFEECRYDNKKNNIEDE